MLIDEYNLGIGVCITILPSSLKIHCFSDNVLFVFHMLTVQKPEKVSWFEAAAVIKDGLRAYTALHTLARMAAGQTVLVLDGAGVGICAEITFLMIPISFSISLGSEVLTKAASI